MRSFQRAYRNRSHRFSCGHIGRWRCVMGHSVYDPAFGERPAWNAGRKVGSKRALKPKQIWEIRFWLDRERRLRDRALFDLAIDSKLRGCDIVKIRIGDLVSGGAVRAIVIQQKTGRPVQFELTDTTRASLLAWLERRGGSVDDFASQAEQITRTTSAPGNMPGWWMSGSPGSVCGQRSMARTLCVEQRRPSFIRRRAIFAQSKSCSGIPRSRTRSDISASM